MKRENYFFDSDKKHFCPYPSEIHICWQLLDDSSIYTLIWNDNTQLPHGIPLLYMLISKQNFSLNIISVVSIWITICVLNKVYEMDVW